MPVFIANRFSQAKTDGQLSLRLGMEPQQFHSINIAEAAANESAGRITNVFERERK